MPFYDGLLMRDSLGDTGVVPSPGYPYYAPDVICHDQVANPQQFFSGNYSGDPSQPVQLGSHTNLLYTRAMNLSTSVKSGWSIHLYRASSSLFLNPSIWRNNVVSTQSGQSSVPLADVQPNAVVVAGEPFILDALASNLFCLIAIASSSPSPSIPSGFSAYADYISWVRQNQNVCGRNLSLVRNFPSRQYERLDTFSNPESTSVPTLFRVSVSGSLPAGTTFGLTCAPLSIATSWNVSQGPVQTASGMTPASFDGTVTTWGSLPAGVSQWPSNATIDTTVYVGVDAEHPAAAAAASFDELGIGPDEAADLVPNGQLVRLGNCATAFVTQ